MQAVTYHRYGSPEELRLEEVETPVPKDEEIRIRIQAVSINGSDREGLVGKPLYARSRGLRRPGSPILGSDIAGVVDMAGKNHTEFKVGDEIFGEIPGYHGGLAEYVCTRGSTMLKKPASLSFEQAAAIPQGGSIALRGIRDVGRVRPGQSVLINGAGGSAGSFAVPLAKLLGAEVSAVDCAGKLNFLRRLGADHVIDFARQDFARSAVQYDLILDLMAQRSIFACRRALKPNGVYLCVGGSLGVILQLLLLGPLLGRNSGRSLRLLAVPQNRKDLAAITELIEAGQVRPMIERVYPLAEAAEAFRHIHSGRALGKIVIRVAQEAST